MNTTADAVDGTEVNKMKRTTRKIYEEDGVYVTIEDGLVKHVGIGINTKVTLPNFIDIMLKISISEQVSKLEDEPESDDNEN